jgi:hypothetical protein
VSAAWNIVKQVLSEQTRSKVAFLGTTAQFRECLVADLGPENVFPKWGGQKPVGSKGDPEHGTIRIGGRPPDHIRFGFSIFINSILCG